MSTFIEVVVPGPTYVEVEVAEGPPGPPGPQGPPGEGGGGSLPAAPTGELGGTWAATTVDALHSGTSHAETEDNAKLFATGLITSHVGAADPHAGYLTPAEANAAYTPIAHTGGGDPHPMYQTTAEGNTAVENAISYHAADSDAHQAEIHPLVSSKHTYAGLTTGHVLTATGATAAAFQAPSGGGGVVDASYLVGAAHAGLSAEIVVGATPGGELGGTWAAPTVDATHAGSAHLALGSTGATAAAGNHTHAGGAGAFGFPYTWRPDTQAEAAFTVPAGPNRGVFYRLYEGGTITFIWYTVNTTGGNISVAMYANSGAARSSVPGTRLVTSGAIPTPAAGYVETTVGSTLIAAGDWVALSADGVTAKFIGSGTSIEGDPMKRGFSGSNAAAHPLPTPAPAITPGAGRVLHMGGG